MKKTTYEVIVTYDNRTAEKKSRKECSYEYAMEYFERVKKTGLDLIANHKEVALYEVTTYGIFSKKRDVRTIKKARIN